jgi:hypothetical protein
MPRSIACHLGVIATGTALTALFFYPGCMSGDAQFSWGEALNNSGAKYHDWHPPLVAYTWYLLNQLPVKFTPQYANLFVAGLMFFKPTAFPRRLFFLALSGIVYGASYFVAAASADFRYLYWLVVVFAVLAIELVFTALARMPFRELVLGRITSRPAHAEITRSPRAQVGSRAW